MQDLELLTSFLPLIILVLVFYLLVFRPQQQQKKKHAEMITNLKRGDKIVSNGGFICEVLKQEDGFITVKLGDNHVKLAKEYVAYKIDDFPESTGEIDSNNQKDK